MVSLPATVRRSVSRLFEVDIGCGLGGRCLVGCDDGSVVPWGDDSGGRWPGFQSAGERPGEASCRQGRHGDGEEHHGDERFGHEPERQRERDNGHGHREDAGPRPLAWLASATRCGDAPLGVPDTRRRWDLRGRRRVGRGASHTRDEWSRTLQSCGNARSPPSTAGATHVAPGGRPRTAPLDPCVASHVTPGVIRTRPR